MVTWNFHLISGEFSVQAWWNLPVPPLAGDIEAKFKPCADHSMVGPAICTATDHRVYYVTLVMLPDNDIVNRVASLGGVQVPLFIYGWANMVFEIRRPNLVQSSNSVTP